MPSRPFTHHDRGTGESAWLLDDRWETVPRLCWERVLECYPKVLLLAPHPDDETLSLGATLADLADRAISVTVVVATHGGNGPASTPRRIEAECAITTLGPQIATIWWDLPDGGLADQTDEITAELGALVDSQTLVLAPVECDGHSDHEALARAAYAVAHAVGAALLLYPVWLWHWATPDDLDWTRLRSLSPSLRALHTKRSALESYTSQLSAPDGHPVVGEAMRARASRVIEIVLLPVTAELADRLVDHIEAHRLRDQIAAPFDSMFENGVSDPWHLDESDYEKRRHALVLACLGRPHYRSVLEIGCATGQLAVQLRSRADHVIGMDTSSRAIEVARNRTDTIEWLHGAAPVDMPERDVDLVVFSEVAYFLDGPELLAALRAARRCLRAGGEILMANWAARTEQIPLDGPTVTAQAAALFDLPRRAHYHDADLTIEVWGEPVSVYDACAGSA